MDRGFLRIADGPGLVVVTKDRFRRWGAALDYMSQDAFELEFISPDAFELKSMEGTKSLYTKAKPITLNADNLKEFTGEYKSGEIGSTFKVEPGEGGLLIALKHTPERQLKFEPITSDVFRWNNKMTIRFKRSPSGQVVSLDYSNPVLNEVNFERVN